MTDTRTSTLREAEYDDYQTAVEFLRGLGLIFPGGADDIHDNWRRFWVDNPALDVDRSKIVPGWLLEDNGQMVGFFGNIPLLYDFGGRPIIVANASQIGVDKNYRGETQRLAEAYFNQDHADLLLVTTAIKPTGRFFERNGGIAVPQSNYDQVLYWVLNTRGFLQAGLLKKGVPSAIATTAALAGGPLASAALALSGHRQHRNPSHIEIINTAEIGDEFDGLWQRKRDETVRLMACRTADCLRWHFGSRSMSHRTRLLLSRGAEGLAGYAAIVREDVPEIGLKRLKIIDLFVAGDNMSVIDDLLDAAFETGRLDGCDVLELVGLPDPLRQHIISRHRPRSRPMPTWPLYYKSLRNDLNAPLLDQRAWYVTSYDGDTAFF